MGLRMSKEPVFVDTPLPSPITEFVVQITSNVDGADHYVSGTGVVVSPYLAFAARHVFEDHWRRHHSEPMPLEPEAVTRFSFILAQQVGDELNLWNVTRVWASGETDIILLRLTPFSKGAQEYKFRHMTLAVLPPPIGTQIHAFGYAESFIEVAGPRELSIRHRPRSTHGEVIEVFPGGRDRIAMPFPCFRTNARFDGGMSGGPIFNETGHLCGLICSSYPPFEADEQHASYGVMLWPIMGMPIDLARAGYAPGARYAVHDLVKDKMLVVSDADKLTVGPLPEVGGASVELFVPAERLQGQKRDNSTISSQEESDDV